MENVRFLVSVNCMTFNQASYIEDAMNGFTMQQTNFPFVCTIVDDASTDGEPEIIRKYLDSHFDIEALNLPTADETDEYVRFYARHKENRNCYFLVFLLKYNHYSINKPKLTSVDELLTPIPYFAPCEGDDYWIDSLKLQKQVDFLENHEEYGFVGSHCIIENKSRLVEEKSKITHVEEDKDFLLCGNVFSDAKWGPVTRTCTLVYRRSLVAGFAGKVSGDIVLETVLAKYSYYACYNSYASVYRTGVGVSSVKHDYDKALRYNEYVVKSRLKQKELFPVDCPWDEDELDDSTTYIKLKHSIELFRYLDAMRLKKQLKTNLYKNKNYAKRMKGFFSFVILFFMIKLKG